mmetsp:Transcript_55816/g.135228  ORF Transcript_55816/g.135228 Transcript_55816/m.135228 type:complete len:130 (+) Transcript_55816:119-508(+)|eukprot:CAMPEP_0113452584 /NCGR_PEP_ID=MMETSP0014_2-20120614/6922_1 /TAXON_ID=2857 /ORGANISM="Nitzschia sp." /LENGTH=129 /DNA_ID=CAMNT_0000343961 /DNA_START=111 /DNA_END=500 /DNA_ORIENTATION=- /assembly_acc=CAM_ASM_000159
MSDDDLKKEDNDPMASVIEKLSPVMSQMSFGSVMGFCSGYAMKKAGKAVAVVVGLGFVALQTASSYGYLEVKWQKISDDAKSTVDSNKDGKFDKEDIKVLWKKLKVMLTKNLPSNAGFSLGFLYGVKSG